LKLGSALERRWLSLPPRSHAVRHQIEWVALADGVRLATTILLPAGPGPWPALLVRTASDARSWLRTARLIAESGYAVVVQECRGRQASEGTFAPFVAEAADGAGAIEWLARQAWFDGRLALAGQGYAGFAAWAALSASPHPVTALVSAFAARDPHALLRPGGALALELALRFGVGVGERAYEAIAPQALERGCEHRPLREADRVTLRRVDWFREWIDHPKRDGYWAARTPALPDTPPAVLTITGWCHPALAAQLADHAELCARAKRSGAPEPELVVGPWPGGQPDWRRARRTRSEPRAETVRSVLDFLARRLRGGNPLSAAPVRVFVRGALAWYSETAWPLPGCAPAAWHLRGAGRANGRGGDGSLARDAPGPEEHADTFSYDPRDPVLTDDAGAACRDDVLCYTSERFSEPLLLGGPVRAQLFVASSAAESDFTAALLALDDAGAAHALCAGIVRSRGAEGVPRRIEVELGGACARLERGSRLRLEISSSCFPRWDRPSHTGVEAGAAGDGELAAARQTVFHDRARPSQLWLPLRAARSGAAHA
jgi:putative CocE/NonD family hydrolase